MCCRGGAGPTAGGRAPYPNQCGFTVVESSVSSSQYSLPTIEESVEEPTEQFGGLATCIKLCAGMEVLLPRETTGNTQSSGMDGSLTLQEIIDKS